MLVGSEEDLFLAIEDLFVALDPDIVVGWDLERASLGYVLDRAPFVRRNDEHSHHETGNVRKRSAGNNKTPHRSSAKGSDKAREDGDGDLDMVRRLSRVPDEPRDVRHNNDDFLSSHRRPSTYLVGLC